MNPTRYEAHSRETGTLVSIEDGIAGGYDTEAGRWQTICHDHSWIISHQTLALARSFVSHPTEWCDYCASNLLYRQQRQERENASHD